jgi:hypothetical protein
MKVPILTVAIAITLGVTTSTALAETPGSLPSEKSAGLHQTRQDAGPLFWTFGAAGLIVFGIAIALPNNGNSPTASTPSTAATP